MDVDDWQLEMQHLMEVFERESTVSLRKINRRFVILNRPFDEKFRQCFLNMSVNRLNTGFNTILFERCFEGPTQEAQNPNGAIDAEHNVDFLAASNTRDEGAIEDQQLHAMNGPIVLQKNSNSPRQPSDDHVDFESDFNGPELNAENGIEFYIKREIKAEVGTGIETMDLPIVAFDPVKENERVSAENDAHVPRTMDAQSHPGSSSNSQQQKERGASKIFKCKNCAYATPHKGHLNRHQLIHDKSAVKSFECEQCDYATNDQSHLKRHRRVHTDQKLVGLARDPNDGLYKCTHCTRNFTCFAALNLHWMQSHKNNQRLFNCGHCMRQFTQKSEKDRHGMECKNRHYECYLCKKYVSKRASNMQEHMRTHSGVKPFQCAVCSRSFGLKRDLRRHLNSVHSRISK